MKLHNCLVELREHETLDLNEPVLRGYAIVPLELYEYLVRTGDSSKEDCEKAIDALRIAGVKRWGR